MRRKVKKEKNSRIIASLPWRGARVVERGGLENRCTCEGTEGSNPSLSATLRSSNFRRYASEVELGVSHEALV